MSPEERPQGACVLHSAPLNDRPWKKAETGYLVCDPCFEALRTRLWDVRDRYHRLDATPGASGEAGSRGAPGFGSKPPASPHVIAVRDHRSSVEAHVWKGGDGRVHQESTKAPFSTQSVLETEAFDIAERRDVRPPTDRTVAGLVRWIDVHLDWMTREGPVIEFARTLRSLQTQLMPLTGDPRIWVAKCPNVIDLGDTTEECEANLYYPSSGDVIQCGNPKCRRRWHRTEWNSDKPGSLSRLLEDRRTSRKVA